MIDDNPIPCARCGHPAISHAYGSCRECAQQDLHAASSVAPPAHLFSAPTDATDLKEADRVRKLDQASTYEAWSRMVNGQDVPSRPPEAPGAPRNE
jgi:hypothetical protein